MQARRPERPVSLSERVYGALRAEIISGARGPGTQLVEADLAAQHGVSKTPVREALSKLRGEGLVRVLPRRGYLIEALTVAQVIALLEVRGVLESGAAELAAVRVTPEQSAELRKLAHTRLVAGSTRQAELVRANRVFHLRAAEASQNSRLVELLAQCLDGLERAFFLGARLADVVTEVQADHVALVDALAAHDGEAARRVVMEQVEHTKRNFLRGLGITSTALSSDAGVRPRQSRKRERPRGAGKGR